MRVAVVTPYYTEDIDILRCCHDSVRAQTHPCTHIMVADGFPNAEVAGWPVQHAVLPRAHGAGGALPRGIGSACAINQGFDAIAYLDADNWFHPEHVATMVALQRATGADACIALRSMHRLDGSPLRMPEPLSDGLGRYYDTSCMFLTRTAFGAAGVWAMLPPEAGPICDRVVSLALHRRGLSLAQADAPTVGFRTSYAEDYALAGEAPPPGAKPPGPLAQAAAHWNRLPPAWQNTILGFPVQPGALRAALAG